jgi:hypothetical protein
MSPIDGEAKASLGFYKLGENEALFVRIRNASKESKSTGVYSSGAKERITARIRGETVELLLDAAVESRNVELSEEAKRDRSTFDGIRDDILELVATHANNIPK